MRPIRLLDLFCGAGGGSMGYAQAGLVVTGVDREPQPRYPFKFIQADAMEVLQDPLGLRRYDVIHASPPCQRYTKNARQKGTAHMHPDLVPPVREKLERVGLPYVIENVLGAPLRDPIMLCGTMFGLGVFRHRLFEISSEVSVPQPPHERHKGHIGDGYHFTVTGHTGYNSTRDGRFGGSIVDWRRAMGISWMTCSEIVEAIPPAYTHHIGNYVMDAYGRSRETEAS